MADVLEATESVNIDSKTVEVLLKPLFIDDQAIAKAYRKRKMDFNTEKFHVADVPEKEAKGWKVLREGKRFSSMKRAKPLSQKLEDRLWSLCKQMGYRH